MKTPREEKLPTPTDCLLSKGSVKARLGGIGEKALRRLIATGRLPVVKLGGRTAPLRFRAIDVRRLIEASTITAPKPGEDGGRRMEEGKEPTP